MSKDRKEGPTAENEELLRLLRTAYLGGFNASGEGYNGEYPFGDYDERPEYDTNWRADRDQYLELFLERQSEAQKPITPSIGE